MQAGCRVFRLTMLIGRSKTPPAQTIQNGHKSSQESLRGGRQEEEAAALPAEMAAQAAGIEFRIVRPLPLLDAGPPVAVLCQSEGEFLQGPRHLVQHLRRPR